MKSAARKLLRKVSYDSDDEKPVRVIDFDAISAVGPGAQDSHAPKSEK